MARTCSECTYMDFDKEHDCDGKFWCEKKYEWHYADEAECWRFCQAYSRSSSTAESYRRYSKDKQSSGGCFITTLVCDIMGQNDNCDVLQSLRSFRNDIMHNHELFRNILLEYDILGPYITRALRMDKESKSVANALYTTSITKVSEFIKKKEYSKAVRLYKEMTNGLVEYYGIKKNINPDYIDNMDIKLSGHGRYVKV